MPLKKKTVSKPKHHCRGRPLEAFHSVLCELIGSILHSDSGHWFQEVAHALAALHAAHSVCRVKCELMYYCLETDSQLVLKDECFQLNSHYGIFSHHYKFL